MLPDAGSDVTERPLRIAVASAHLGTVNRGAETWARDLASSLADRGMDVTLFKGAGAQELSFEQVVPSLPIGSLENRCLHRILPGFTWRIGFSHPHEIAERTFGLALLPRLGRRFDIVHTQDTLVAGLTHWAWRRKLIQPATVYAHGTGATLKILRRFRYVQALTPAQKQEADTEGASGHSWTVIPNFVDPQRFHPTDQAAACSRWGLPKDAKIVLTVGALDHPMKRIDFLIRAFAKLIKRPGTERYHLLAVGSLSGDSKHGEVVRLGQALLGSRVTFLSNVSQKRMPELYACADAFVLCSINEPFGIVLLEAAASGLPCVTADTPSFRWIVGSDGFFVDMLHEDALTNGLDAILHDDALRKRKADAVRQHCLANFARDIVVGQVIDYYRTIISIPSQPRAH
jgi:glycosyltransferase involved in cell wall biosynthesis